MRRVLMSTVLVVKNIEKYYGNKGNITKAVDDISFEVNKGEFIGIMGASGSGKTTLLNCISCYLPADSGSILLNGTNLARLNETEISKIRNEKLGFIFQDFLLLDGLTVLENIMIPRIIGEHVDSSMEKRAAKLCEIFGISHIKNKYPADISGGEKQRISIARALLLSPALLILDEATAAMDTETERLIGDALAKLVKGRTTITIAHRLSTLKDCNYLFAIENGEIAEEGTPEELMAKKGVYFKLYTLQSQAMRKVLSGM